ncbi:MAG: polysaccharide deacetylase family protein [Chlamydiota bacterium]|jgi:peptidoglycan/xylan/chitin deacetylase (PgdA/CDA1 family)
MLLTFLYHQVGLGKYANTLSLLDKQFSYLAQKYPVVIPGDPLKPFSTSVCLTFDDATKDFYQEVFPLLKKYQIKALLAVPVSLIETPNYCNWQMLREIYQSKLVKIASHSMTHAVLTNPKIDYCFELTTSKKILENQLQTKVDTFVYPFGKFNRNIHKEAKKHYRYIMRIGSSCNLSWNNFHHLNYRIPSDNLSHYLENLTLLNKIKYSFNFLKNTIRLR